MIKRMLILSLLVILPLVAGCQQGTQEEPMESSKTGVAASAPATTADCEQQLAALLANPVCTAMIKAEQVKRHKRRMDGYGEMNTTRPHANFPTMQ